MKKTFAANLKAGEYFTISEDSYESLTGNVFAGRSKCIGKSGALIQARHVVTEQIFNVSPSQIIYL